MFLEKQNMSELGPTFPIEPTTPTPPISNEEHEDIYEDNIALIVGTKNFEEAKKSWQTDLKNPEHHNDQEYCYLITGIMSGGASAQKQLLFSESGIYDPELHIDLLEEPSRIAEKQVISASIIDHEHRGTFGSCGIVLSAPYENAVAAYCEDAGTHSDWDKLAKPKTIVPTIPEVLDATYPTDYNEIVLRGSSPDGQVSISGFWAKVTKDGDPINEEGFEKTRELAFDMKLPFIQIKQESVQWNESTPEFHRNAKGKIDVIAFHRNGIRYCFNLYEHDPDFIIVDTRAMSRKMTREEFDFSYKLLDDEVSNTDKSYCSVPFESIPELYREKPLPTVNRESKTGELESITIDRGWTRYLLYFSGKPSLVIDASEGVDSKFMNAENFKYMKNELLRDLKGDDLEAFLKKLPSFERSLVKR